MPVYRGLVPPAIIASTIALIACCVAWGALGVVALLPTVTIDTELYRFTCSALASATICSAMVNLTARIIRAIRDNVGGVSDDGYAGGYADGLAAAQARGNVTQMPPRGSIRS